MDENRLAELLGTTLNYLIKKGKIKEVNLDDFLMDELGVEESELNDIYDYIEETRI